MTNWGLVVLVAVIISGDRKGTQDPKSDKKALQGEWIAVFQEVDGTRTPDEAVRFHKMAFRGDKVKYTVLDMDPDEGSFTIDPQATPKHLDWKTGGETILCIYALRDDTLRVCFPGSGKNRPAEFSAGPKSGQCYMVFKRKRAERR